MSHQKPRKSSATTAPGRSGQVRLILWLVIAMLGVQLPAARGATWELGEECRARPDAAEQNSSCCCEFEASPASTGCPMSKSETPSKTGDADDSCDCSFTPESPIQLPFVDCAPIGVNDANEIGRVLKSHLQVAMHTPVIDVSFASTVNTSAPPRDSVAVNPDSRVASFAAARLQQGGIRRLLSELSSLLI